MNIGMHGKAVESIQFEDGSTGNPGIWRASAASYIELSATHHGDHDEFWIVSVDVKTGYEIARRRASSCTEINWVRP